MNPIQNPGNDTLKTFASFLFIYLFHTVYILINKYRNIFEFELIL